MADLASETTPLTAFATWSILIQHIDAQAVRRKTHFTDKPFTQSVQALKRRAIAARSKMLFGYAMMYPIYRAKQQKEEP